MPKSKHNPYENMDFDKIPDGPVTIADDEIGIKFSPDVSEDSQHRIYIVWTIGQYKNEVRLLDIRAITTSLSKAKLYSKMLRRDKEPGEIWDRVVIEPRVANHLYGEKWREYLVNVGKM